MENLKNLIKPKHVTTIKVQEKTQKNGWNYSKILEKIWNLRIQQKIPKLTLMIENAEKIDSVLLELVTDEGIKNGLAMVLITKQPLKLGINIFSQINTYIIGKTLDANFLSYLKEIIPTYSHKIPKLSQKQWIINTNNQLQTTQIRIRKCI